jgi:arylsulfatase A-like enzyme
MPRSSAAVAALTPSPPPSINKYRGVALRLVDVLPSAHVEVPSMSDRQIRAILTNHWRRHLAPFTGPSGERARLVQAVGLERHPPATQESVASATSGSTNAAAGATKRASSERATALKPGGRAAKPARPGQVPSKSSTLSLDDRHERDVRTFGLGEGSYDERECIVAPTPSRLRFPLQLRHGGLLRLAPAILGDGDATFRIGLRRQPGDAVRQIASKTLHGPTRRFDEWEVELDLDTTTDAELELTTESTGREPALTLWGSPVLVAPAASSLPYNVLFIIVDAMRGDAIAASHDPAEDDQRRRSERPALDAWFAPMPEVAPELNRLAARGAIWEHAWSNAMWTRPSTVSLLTGLRASHAGLDVLGLELAGDQRRNFYAQRPPLLPLQLRRGGATTAAIVNNMYLSGSVGVGVDFGFESVVDHRFQALDTDHITKEASRFLALHRSERFFLLLNYASPHAPYVPPVKHLRAVRVAQNRPEDLGVLNYLAEIHKDDAAIGQILRQLEQLNLTQDTLVVVTADHGETMSAAHDVVALDVAQGVPSGRFTHLSTMWEEAARVGLLMALPGKIPAGLRSKTRVQGFDILPTILELEALKVPDAVEGSSLVPLFEGRSLPERPILIEGRGARSVIADKYHFIARDPVARRLRFHGDEYERSVELYDLQQDPGERHDIAPQHPELVASLRALLERTVSTKQAMAAPAKKRRWHFLFSSAGKARHLEVSLHAAGARVMPVQIEARAIRTEADGGIHITTDTSAAQAVGFDIEWDDAVGEPTWTVALDGQPWPEDRVFVGTLGLAAPGVARGVTRGFDLSQLDAAMGPHVVPTEELGLFITRDIDTAAVDVETSQAAQLEAQQAMQAWGYARKPVAKPSTK